METVECNCGSMFTEVEDDDVSIIHYEDCDVIQNMLGVEWL